MQGVDSPKRVVRVFWDIENLQMPSPRDIAPFLLCKRIQMVARKLGQLQECAVYTDPNRLTYPAGEALRRSQFVINAVRSSETTRKEVADKAIVEDVLTWVWDVHRLYQNTQPCVVLITSDNDFCTLISRLENRDVDVQVITRTMPGTHLYETSNTIAWEDLLRGSEPGTHMEPTSNLHPTVSSLVVSHSTASSNAMSQSTASSYASNDEHKGAFSFEEPDALDISPTVVVDNNLNLSNSSTLFVSSAERDESSYPQGVLQRLLKLIAQKGPLLGAMMPELYRVDYMEDLKSAMLREGHKKIRSLLESEPSIRITRHGSDSLYSVSTDGSVLVKVPLERISALPLRERLLRLLHLKGTMYGAVIPGAYIDEYGETLQAALQREGLTKLKEILQCDERVSFEQHGGDFEYTLSPDYIPLLSPRPTDISQPFMPVTPRSFLNLQFPKNEWDANSVSSST